MAPKSKSSIHIPVEKRFKATLYKPEACDLALQGKQIPQALGDQVNQSCVVRGIRRYPGFATELRGTLPVFTRALNARDIMSNIIPEMSSPDEFPYCIWYPEVAEERTYRDLVKKYPQMNYNVGRACAVAGYTDLYRELDLLPDVHIAEEARDNKRSEILQDIMSRKDRFSVMDDYRCQIGTDLSTLSPANLNGDTAVRSSLDVKRRHFKPSTSKFQYELRDCYFNITEDFCIDSKDFLPESIQIAQRLAVEYLYTPLPVDLPPLQKDLLILIAAYNGDIDRYSRLRRPNVWLSKEMRCVIRGIYHSTYFAKWWSRHLEDAGESDCTPIRRAINARAIMNNDLSRVSPETPAWALPYCIWYPAVPRPITLELLFQIRPEMAPQIARACIVASDGSPDNAYRSLHEKIDPEPDEALLAEAKASVDQIFFEHIERKLAETGVDGVPRVPNGQGWKMTTRSETFEPSSMWLKKHVGCEDINTGFDWLYDGTRADISNIDLNVSVLEGRLDDDGAGSMLNFESSLDGAEDLDLGVSYLQQLEQPKTNV